MQHIEQPVGVGLLVGVRVGARIVVFLVDFEDVTQFGESVGRVFSRLDPGPVQVSECDDVAVVQRLPLLRNSEVVDEGTVEGAVLYRIATFSVFAAAAVAAALFFRSVYFRVTPGNEFLEFRRIEIKVVFASRSSEFRRGFAQAQHFADVVHRVRRNRGRHAAVRRPRVQFPQHFPRGC